MARGIAPVAAFTAVLVAITARATVPTAITASAAIPVAAAVARTAIATDIRAFQAEPADGEIRPRLAVA